MLTILIGMSASGKDAILRELVANHGFREIVTTTTRPMRKGEVNGKDYNFISRKEFEKGITEGRFFEYRSYNTIWNGKEDVWYYGTPKMQLNPEQDYVAIVDVQGAKDYVSYFGKYDCFVVRVNASEEVRTKRAKKRGSFDKDEWERRLAADRLAFSEENTAQTDSFAVNYSVANEGDKTVAEIAEKIAIAADTYGRKDHSEIDHNPCQQWGEWREVSHNQLLTELKEDVSVLMNNILECEDLLRNLSKREPYPDFDIEKGLKHIQLF